MLKMFSPTHRSILQKQVQNVQSERLMHRLLSEHRRCDVSTEAERIPAARSEDQGETLGEEGEGEKREERKRR